MRERDDLLITNNHPNSLCVEEGCSCFYDLSWFLHGLFGSSRAARVVVRTGTDHITKRLERRKSRSASEAKKINGNGICRDWRFAIRMVYWGKQKIGETCLDVSLTDRKVTFMQNQAQNLDYNWSVLVWVGTHAHPGISRWSRAKNCMSLNWTRPPSRRFDRYCALQ